MFWAFFDEKYVFSYYCKSRFWHRDPGSEVFQHRNPGSEKGRRDCKPYSWQNFVKLYFHHIDNTAKKAKFKTLP
jgi:hypothetical protein